MYECEKMKRHSSGKPIVPKWNEIAPAVLKRTDIVSLPDMPNDSVIGVLNDYNNIICDNAFSSCRHVRHGRL